MCKLLLLLRYGKFIHDKRLQSAATRKALDLNDPGLALCKHCLQLVLLDLVDRFWLGAFLYLCNCKIDALSESRLGHAGHLDHGTPDLGKGGHHSATVAVGRRRAEAALHLRASAFLRASRDCRARLVDSEEAGTGGRGLDV